MPLSRLSLAAISACGIAGIGSKFGGPKSGPQMGNVHATLYMYTLYICVQICTQACRHVNTCIDVRSPLQDLISYASTPCLQHSGSVGMESGTWESEAS